MNILETKFRLGSSSGSGGSGGVSSSQINAINSEIEEIWEAISQHVDITNSIVDKLAVTSATSTSLESTTNSYNDSQELITNIDET